jgi:hypothetical protein
MRQALVFLGIAMVAGRAAAQTQLGRPEQKGFPLAATPSVGFAFGAPRATYFDPAECASAQSCYGYGTGSGWQAGLDIQIPIGRVLGFEIGGQVGRPSLKQCLRGQCTTVDRTWSVRGSGTLLWRLKARAPVYFGLGGVYTYFTPGPVLVYQEGISVSEVGGTVVVGIDLSAGQQLGGRIVWRGYLLIPSSKGMPDPDALKSIAWDNAVSFGVRILLGR